MRAAKVMALATVVLAACSDPTFDVDIDARALPGEVGRGPDNYELTISVISAVDAGAAAFADGRAATCDDIAYNRIPADIVEGARRASMSYGGRLSGVPRVEDKLVLVEARKGGKRLGAGCEPWGEVTGDTVVKVVMELAPDVRIFEREDTADPSSVRLLLTVPGDEKAVVANHRVITEMHASDATSNRFECVEPDFEGCKSDTLGQYVTPLIDPPSPATTWPPGPAQTLVRVKWAEELIRIPSFRFWPTIDTGSQRITLVESPTPGYDSVWAFRPQPYPDIETIRIAAALQQRAVGEEEIVVVEYHHASGTLSRFTVPAPGARALTFFNGQVITALPATPGNAAGFYFVNPMQALTYIGPGIGSGPVQHLHAVSPCADGGEGRLLARRGGAYTAYQPDGMVATDDFAALVAEINAGDENVVSSACLSLDDGSMDPPLKQVVLSRPDGLGLRARVVDSVADVALLPEVSAAAVFEVIILNKRRMLAAGVETTLAGPRATSYKLTELDIGGDMPITGFVPEDRIDTPLATIPDSFDVYDVDSDGTFDLVAAIATPGGARLQTNLGRVVNREAVSAISAVLDGGRRSSHPQVRFVNVDKAGRAELMVATDEGLDIYCLDPERPQGGALCVP